MHIWNDRTSPDSPLKSRHHLNILGRARQEVYSVTRHFSYKEGETALDFTTVVGSSLGHFAEMLQASNKDKERMFSPILLTSSYA